MKNKFSRHDVQMTNKHVKRYRTILAIRKVQIKITTECHLIPLGWWQSIINNNECWRKCGEIGTFLYSWWELNGIAASEHSLAVIQMINIVIIGPRNSIPPDIHRINENLHLHNGWHMKVLAALFTIATEWKQPESPLTDKWINIMW